MPDRATLLQRLKEMDEADEASPEHVDLLLELVAQESFAHPQEALAHSEAALSMARALGYERGIALGLGRLGWLYSLRSDYDAASALLQEAIPRCEALGDDVSLARILGAMGSIELSRGNYEEALTYGLQALQRQQAVGDEEQIAWTYHGLGTGYLETGDIERGRAYYQQSCTLFEALGNDVGIARALTGLGAVHQALGQPERARPFHERSLQLYRQADNHVGIARALNDLGMLALDEGRPAEALEYHRQSLALRESIGSRQAQATSLINMGRVYLGVGQYDQALLVLQRALAIGEAVASRPKIYQAHQYLADAYEALCDLERALRHHRAFQTLREAVMGEAVMARFNRLQYQHDHEQAEKEAEQTRLRNEALRAKNEQLERLLDELSNTQRQLIQAEKMASLGRLTAGIAHEIKNPLNFVTNFAWLTAELAQDLEAELEAFAAAPDADRQAEMVALLEDIRFNTRKINEHGDRADRIVKNMMLHARGQQGDPRPTDLNGLLDEYVNLAYHGMRAQEPAFNVTIERSLDEAVGMVSVVPQDVSRVFLNLLSNAFYAVLKRIDEASDYTPRVRLVTVRDGDTVTVSITDNGGGIPEALQPRIFEPFFTTKPTGAGTGLGLSLSYEIIAAGHGGALTFESTPGEGTTFIISLPAPPVAAA